MKYARLIRGFLKELLSENTGKKLETQSVQGPTSLTLKLEQKPERTG